MKIGYLEAYNIFERIEYLSSNFYKTNLEIAIQDNSLTIYKTHIPGKRIGDRPSRAKSVEIYGESKKIEMNKGFISVKFKMKNICLLKLVVDFCTFR